MKQAAALYAASLTLLVLLAPGCCGTGLRPAMPSSGEARTPVEQDIAAVIVVGACLTPEGRVTSSFGSGVLISDHAALTAAHVVTCPAEAATGVIVKFPGSEQHARVLVLDLEGDVARLDLEKPVAVAPARIGPRPELDDRVCVVASVPERGRRCGSVELLREPPGDVKHNAITMPGNSGSGVYDASGRLVGIVTHYAKLPNGQFYGGAFTSLEGRPWVLR